MAITREVLTLEEAVKRTLRAAGFLTEKDEYVAGLIDAENALKKYEVALRHGRILDKNIEEAIDWIYETPSTLMESIGHTCIYFKKVNKITSEKVNKIRQFVWNMGRAPVLWIISPTQANIYNAFARPEPGETEETHLLQILKITSEGLKNVGHFRRESFDTGEFWLKEGQKIRLEQRVDESLLDDLWETERLLTKECGLGVNIAHALIGRMIFIRYLWDREIITPKFLKNKFEHRDFLHLLKDKNQLYNLFKWLRKTFNGDLFPIKDDEEDHVKQIHLDILFELFTGSKMKDVQIKNNKVKSTQRKLWPYCFDIIPIELISSIYEMFAHSINPIDARSKSIHYTKVHLVELVLSLTMNDLSHDAIVLDPACGSGVFLVDAFRRLIWKKRHELGRKTKNGEICNILLNQIYGIDIEPGAIYVTAFSLYLALLELDESFNNINDIKFPKLIYHKEWDENYRPTLYIQDICNTQHEFNRNEPFKGLKFDLIVGNLPWTKLRKKTAPRDPESHLSGKQWSLEYCRKKKIYRNHPDQAIMIHVKNFAKPKTKIAFIISSRVFYQQKKAKGEFWLNSFLKENSVELIVNLTDLSSAKILFGGKDKNSPGMPASIIIYTSNPPKENSSIKYICPKWYFGIKNRGAIIIHPPDVQTISNKLLIDNPHLWKIAFRGTRRDFELINKLYKNFTLSEALDKIRIPITNYSQGYKLGTKYDKSQFQQYFSIPVLKESEDFKYCIYSKDLPLFSEEKLGRPRTIEVFRGPLLIFRRSLIENEARVAFSPHDTIYTSKFFGISFHNSDERIAHRINAVLNTKLSLYFAFMLGDSFAWHYKMIETKDWLCLPLPESILDLEDERWNKVIAIEQKFCESWNTLNPNEFTKLEDTLFNYISELYGLNEEERILVEDTIAYSMDFFLNRSSKSMKKRFKIKATKKPSLKQLEKYAIRLCKQLNNLLKYENKKLTSQLYKIKRKSPLNIVEFKQTTAKLQIPIHKNEAKEVEGIEELLINISENLKTEVAERLYTWGHLRIYEKDRLYIIKPAEKRFWSESSAINDADAIIREHMEIIR